MRSVASASRKAAGTTETKHTTLRHAEHKYKSMRYDRNEVVVTGEFDGEIMWRLKTPEEKLIERLNLKKVAERIRSDFEESDFTNAKVNDYGL